MEYTVEIHVRTLVPLTMDALEAVGEVSGAAGGMPGDHDLTTTITTEARHPGDAIQEILGWINTIVPAELISSTVMTTAEHDRRLEEPAFPQLVGVTETAEMLGISRQRLAVLRKRQDFPAPVVELAAGPIWRRRDLSTFAGGWQRSPGRPPKVEARAAQVRAAAR